MSLVRSNLSYCSQVWAPQSSINHLILVERLQRQATKYMCKHSELSYKKRLIYLKLLPINYWLEFLDLVLCFKCCVLFINLDEYLYYCNTRTRRAKTGLALNVQHCKTSLHCDSYFNRIVHLWNAIPSTIQTFNFKL